MRVASVRLSPDGEAYAQLVGEEKIATKSTPRDGRRPSLSSDDNAALAAKDQVSDGGLGASNPYALGAGAFLQYRWEAAELAEVDMRLQGLTQVHASEQDRQGKIERAVEVLKKRVAGRRAEWEHATRRHAVFAVTRGVVLLARSLSIPPRRMPSSHHGQHFPPLGLQRRGGNHGPPQCPIPLPLYPLPLSPVV